MDDLFKISKCGSESVKSNAAINAKVEMKNLRFAIDRVKNEAPKCHHMHVGKSVSFCPGLKAHDVPMKKVAQSKYLGDNISADGRMLTTVEARSKKALGTISQIMTMLKELSLGKHYFKIAMTLRNLYFLNSVLCNSEV